MSTSASARCNVTQQDEVDALFGRLRSAGSAGVHLGVSPHNAHALGFYEHLGFARHGNESVVLFTKRL